MTILRGLYLEGPIFGILWYLINHGVGRTFKWNGPMYRCTTVHVQQSLVDADYPVTILVRIIEILFCLSCTQFQNQILQQLQLRLQK